MNGRFWTKPKIYRPTMTLEPLEERIVLDACVDQAGQENFDNGQGEIKAENDPEGANASASQSDTENMSSPEDPLNQVFGRDLKVVLISNALDEIEAISRAAVDGAQVIVYDAEKENLASITDTLGNLVDTNGQRIEHLALFTHGRPGVLDLSETQGLTFHDVMNNPEPWENLAGLLTEDARIDLYGCDIGRGAMGIMLVQAVSEVTGATVWASDDATGNTAGADWYLEIRSGSCHLGSILEPEHIADASIRLEVPSGLPLTSLDNIDFEHGNVAGWDLWPSPGVRWQVISSEESFPTAGYPYPESGHLLVVKAPEDSHGQMIMYRYIDSSMQSATIDHAWYSQSPDSLYCYVFEAESASEGFQATVLAHVGSLFGEGYESPLYYGSSDTEGVVYNETPDALKFAGNWEITFNQGWVRVSHDAPADTQWGAAAAMINLGPGAVAYLDFRVEDLALDSPSENLGLSHTQSLSVHELRPLPEHAGDAGDLWLMPLFSTSSQGARHVGFASLVNDFQSSGCVATSLLTMHTPHYSSNMPDEGPITPAGFAGYDPDYGDSSAEESTLDITLQRDSDHATHSGGGFHVSYYEAWLEELLERAPESTVIVDMLSGESIFEQGNADAIIVPEYFTEHLTGDLKPWEIPPPAGPAADSGNDTSDTGKSGPSEDVDNVDSFLPKANDARLLLLSPHEISLASILTSGAEGVFGATCIGTSSTIGEAISSGQSMLLDPDKISLHDVLALEVTGRINTNYPEVTISPAFSSSLAEAQICLFDMSNLTLADALAA